MTPAVASGLYAALIIGAYCLLCWSCWRRYSQRQVPSRGTDSDTGLLVVFASQSGRAAELAQQTAQQLQAAGKRPHLLPMNRLNGRDLQRADILLLVASTYGEGDPPDMGAGFAHRYLRRDPSSSSASPAQYADLSHLQFGVLALGDRTYTHFCAFGHRLDRHFRRQGAKPLFELIEVDREDSAALAAWQQALAPLLHSSARQPGGFTFHQPQYQPVELLERRCLNPNGKGEPAFHIKLSCTGCPTWQAGDIAAVKPRNNSQRVQQWLDQIQLDGAAEVTHQDTPMPLASALGQMLLPNATERLAGLGPQELVDRLDPIPSRDYSIASTPEQGQIELCVRQVQHSDGSLGLGSGWLTAWAPIGAVIDVHLRDNPAFHAPEAERPLILIGNGTGIAGLRAHLMAREQQQRAPNWLLFGERSQLTDWFFADDLERWHTSGLLTRMDFAFSRDPGGAKYVQDLLPDAANEIRKWLDDGAALYVCGSRDGMAGGVEQALHTLIGAEQLEQLRDSGRYRRDVY